jgi:hypothetical protein
MKKASGLIIYSIFGAGVSILTSFLFMFFGQVSAGGVTSYWGESWLYFATFIPFVIIFTVLGWYFTNRGICSNKKL